MIDPIPHVALFLFVALAIVFAGSTFADLEDPALLRGLPKKVGWFCMWCTVLAAGILLLEHTLASTS